jgi:mannosyl-oligosaccharide alpha-1,2-mannosidase
MPDWSADKEDQMELGRDLAKTCWGSRSFPPVRDSPEAWKADYIIKPLDAHNLQRPETVESLFVMWRVTGDPVYREWGWKTFTAFEKHAKARGGYTSLYNVNAVPSPKRENMESFWLVC